MGRYWVGAKYIIAVGNNYFIKIPVTHEGVSRGSARETLPTGDNLRH